MVEATCRKRVWGNFWDFWRRCSWYREDERACHSDDGGDGGGDDDDDEEEEKDDDDDIERQKFIEAERENVWDAATDWPATKGERLANLQNRRKPNTNIRKKYVMMMVMTMIVVTVK